MHTLSMYQDMRETENTTQKTLDIFPRIRYNNEAVFGKAALVGEPAVPCSLQSAIAGMNSHTRARFEYYLSFVSGVERTVLRNGVP